MHLKWSIVEIFMMTVTFNLLIGCDNKKTEELQELRVEEGLKVSLVAAEPLVIDPVAFTFDENEFLYIVEDRGYPDPAEGGQPHKKEGHIARLEDRDGDGEYDHRSEFATGFTYPNGILPWKGGVFVTCAPDIFYLKDTDGDGIADIREVVLTGFKDTKTSQLRMSHPTLGLDGWVYVTSGLNGGEVVSPLFPDRAPTKFDASDGRFHPETFEFETVGGKNQFGLTFDAYGNRFGCTNRHPVLQVVLEPKYLNRNPYLSFSQTVENVSTVGAEAIVFPLKKISTTSDFIPNLMGRSHQGTFTSASGTFVFNGSGLSDAHKGNVFVCESAQNLVQRQVFKPDGAVFKSELAYVGKEFLASENEWFRPVYMSHGPGGDLYLADMHRKVIDHPSYVPEEIRDKLDFQSGKNMGRIYKVSRQDSGQSLKKVDWPGGSASTAELVSELKSSEEWIRATAFRLLLETNGIDAEITQKLEACLIEAKFPESRIRALSLLEEFGKLATETLERSLSDKDPRVRGSAILLAEDKCSENTQLQKAVFALSKDPDAHVRFKCGLVLGSLRGSGVIETMAYLAIKDGADPWVRAGLLSGVGERMVPFLEALTAEKPQNKEAYALVMKDLGKLFGNGATIDDCQRMAHSVIDGKQTTAMGYATLLGLAEGLSTKGGSIKSGDILGSLLTLNTNTSRNKTGEETLASIYENASHPDKNVDRRIQSIYLLGYTHDWRSLDALGKALNSENPTNVREAAIQAISRRSRKSAAQLLTAAEVWAAFTPTLQSAALNVLNSQTIYIGVLLDAISNGTISASAVPTNNRKRLIQHKDPEIGIRSKELFAGLEAGNRMTIYENYKKNFSDGGEVVEGKVVFERVCASCHSYNGMGQEVGPDLTGINNQPVEAIILHTLVPNYEVYPTYQTIAVQTISGKMVMGWLVSETENSVTLRTASGSDETLLRSVIASLTNTGQSIMPDGLEQTMSAKEMESLIAYLKTGSTF